MGCNCGNKNRAVADGGTVSNGTYVVTVNSRQVYESTSPEAAQAVAARFDNATITGPDGKAL